MSGFAALMLRPDAATAPELSDLLAGVAAQLAPLGPHGAARHILGGVGLAHTLLTTGDRSTVGPFARRDESGELWLTGDIRLDGRGALHREIRADGVAIDADASDETLVLAAWRAWGERAPSHLRGDFSFAVYDASEDALFCARDGLGVRPLFYANTPLGFVCANTIRAVLAHPAVERSLNDAAIVSYLQWGFNTDLATTTFRGVRRLEPGHQFAVRRGTSSTPTRHWRFPEPEPLRYRRDEDYVGHFRSLLDQAVRDRARPAGTALLLSGGLDSTSLAATLRSVQPDTPAYAWTNVIASLRPDDEGALAATVAESLGIRHEIVDDVTVPFSHLDDPAYYTDEPTDDVDGAGWRRLTPRIAAVSPVLFIGEDADALLQPPSIRVMLRHWPAREVLARALRYTLAHRHHPHLGLWLRQRLGRLGRGDAPTVPPWIRRDVLTRTGPQDDAPLAPHSARPETQAMLTGSVWQSVHERSDAIGAGAPLEVRWPFLDTRLLEFALAIPPIPWCQRKELVRRAFRDDLPRSIIERPKTPLPDYYERQIARWRISRRATTPAPLERVREFVDTSGIESILKEGSVAQVLSAWRVLQLEHWLRGQ